MFPVPLGTATVVVVLHKLTTMRKGLGEMSSYACAPGIFCTTRENMRVRCRRKGSITDPGWWGGRVERLFLSATPDELIFTLISRWREI